MMKPSEVKIQITIILLMLISASIACNYPTAGEAIQDAVSERCHEIDRNTYEILASKLGQIPETPKYPESAVYEACTHEKVADFDLYGKEGEISSVRMSEGYRPDEENKIPVGTYTGETNYHVTLENDIDDSYLPPVCTENTIRIVIGSDGTAQGEIRSICYSNNVTDNPDMGMTHHSEVNGMIEGEMLGDAGQLTITYTWREYFTSPQWETTSLDKTVEFVFPYHANILEKMMTLTPAADVEDYYSYKLYKE